MRPQQGSDRERGAILILTSICLTVLVLATSFTVDLGRVSATRRDLQADADVMALDLARLLDGRTTAQIEGDPAWAQAIAASAARNDFGGDPPAVTLGVYDPVADVFQPTGPAEVPTVVRVELGDTVEYFFSQGSKATARNAIAGFLSDEDAAFFQVGSFLLGVDPESDTLIGSVLNQVLPGGSVLSYQGLASATVTLEALGLNMPLGVLSPEELLETQISFEELVLASIGALQAGGGNTAAVAVLNGLLVGATTVRNITLGELFALDAAGGTPAGNLSLDVLGLLTSSAFLIDGEHAITVPATSLGVPGLLDVVVDLTVIEVPQIGGPSVGSVARTGQFELSVTPRINLSPSASQVNVCSLPSGEQNLLKSLLGFVLGALACLLGPVLKPVGVNISGELPITLTAAGAVATLTDIDCTSVPPSISVDPGPQAVDLGIGGLLHATVAGVPLLDADIGATATSVTTAPEQLFLHPAEFLVTRRVGSAPVGLSDLLQVELTDLVVAGVQFNVLAGILRPVVAAALNSLLGQIDQFVVSPLAELFGINLGGVDLTALSLECGGAGSPTLLK
ncbi:TadG family pilus assembly protein [soil metagenome]